MAIQLWWNSLHDDVELHMIALPQQFQVIKSIGFAGLKIEEDMLFDEQLKIVPNKCGRAVGSPGQF